MTLNGLSCNDVSVLNVFEKGALLFLFAMKSIHIAGCIMVHKMVLLMSTGVPN
jgi:hypothetical protein